MKTFAGGARARMRDHHARPCSAGRAWPCASPPANRSPPRARLRARIQSAPAMPLAAGAYLAAPGRRSAAAHRATLTRQAKDPGEKHRAFGAAFLGGGSYAPLWG